MCVCVCINNILISLYHYFFLFSLDSGFLNEDLFSFVFLSFFVRHSSANFFPIIIFGVFLQIEKKSCSSDWIGRMEKNGLWFIFFFCSEKHQFTNWNRRKRKNFSMLNQCVGQVRAWYKKKKNNDVLALLLKLFIHLISFCIMFNSSRIYGYITRPIWIANSMMIMMTTNYITCFRCFFSHCHWQVKNSVYFSSFFLFGEHLVDSFTKKKKKNSLLFFYYFIDFSHWFDSTTDCMVVVCFLMMILYIWCCV